MSDREFKRLSLQDKEDGILERIVPHNLPFNFVKSSTSGKIFRALNPCVNNDYRSLNKKIAFKVPGGAPESCNEFLNPGSENDQTFSRNYSLTDHEDAVQTTESLERVIFAVQW